MRVWFLSILHSSSLTITPTHSAPLSIMSGMRMQMMGCVLLVVVVLLPSTLAETDLSVTADVSAEETADILAYSDTPGFTIQDTSNTSGLTGTWLTLPSPFNSSFSSPENPRLPITPTQTIYRFQYLTLVKDTAYQSPFTFVEIDWNTEGLPRGPNNSFVNPHYDFHFYLPSRTFMKNEVSCPQLVGPSIGRVSFNDTYCSHSNLLFASMVCDPFQTSYTQLRRFLDVPDQVFIPSDYFSDSGSYITQMGLHHLDKLMDYSVENVNLSPVILYGSFDNDVIFLEFSLTAYGFQQVMENGTQSWPIRLPSGARDERWWPQTVQLSYDATTDLFTLGLIDYVQLSKVSAAQPITVSIYLLAACLLLTWMLQ